MQMMVDGPGGRPLDVRVSGPEGAPVVLLHHGTPGAPLPMPAQLELGAERGLRHVCYARPGCSGSARAEGRRVADCAADAAAVLDAVGADDCMTVGWSGGGPHALACAALLGDRVRAAATLAGVAPSDGEDLDWTAGMGQENIEEFGAARAGENALRPYLEGQLVALQTITGPQVADALGDLIDEADRRVLHGGAAEALAAMFRDALARGVDGWLDDDLAFVRPWGFELAAIAVPVTVWQGGQDRMVPAAHGPWLAARIPGAQARFDDAHGHVSLVTDDYGAVLDDLLARAA
jgi:pimeloyl-ACP methyl ester carboxylesterase